MKEKVIKIIDVTILIVVAAICALYACLDLLNLASPDYSSMSFILLSVITLHFISAGFLDMDLWKKNKDISTQIEAATKTIIDSLKGVEINLFEKIEDVDLYIAQRISVAKKSVYDLNWQDHLKNNPNPRNPVVREYTENAIDKSIKDFCSESSAKVYHEIFTFSHSRNFQKMLTHIGYGDKYSCSYYENIKQPKFPKLQFVIIDDEEVVFVSSAYSPNFCAIRDKRIVSIFNNYFNQAWEFSIAIKDKGRIRQDVIDKIRAAYVKDIK
jgi:hypothetical protein